MTQGDDVAQSLGPTEPMWGRLAGRTSLAGWPGVGAISISTLPTYQGGSLHGSSNAQSRWRPSWVASWPGFGELPPKMNGGAHSLHL
jgi:hypothetical protein